MKKKRLLMMMLTAAALLLTASCSKDDDEPQPVNPPAAAGARQQVMMVFAPGQLGDGAYADNVLTGVSSLETVAGLQGKDGIDIQFISLYSVSDTRKALKSWATSTANPFYEGKYERRLLVLTEPYMAAWLADVKGQLGESDEVLIIKSNEAYAQQTADSYGLGSRVHGMDIDISPSIRQYCKYIRNTIAYDDKPFSNIDKPKVVLFRRYDAKLNTYCDGIEDIVRQELGNEVDLILTSLSDEVEEKDFSEETTMSYLEAAYGLAGFFDAYFKEMGYGFVIADLGTSNAGIDYYLYGRQTDYFEVLMIDSDPNTSTNRLALMRNAKEPVIDWVTNWMSQEAGSMPRFKMYDSSYVEHNIPE